MNSVENTKKNRTLDPQKFALWLGIGSIIMMFAGFTSGFLVRKPQGDWQHIPVPTAFYISTIVVLLSSLTMHLAVKKFKEKVQSKHRMFILLTVLLGITFTILQVVGFYELFAIKKWQNNVSFQFLVAIVVVHALHLIGGLIVNLVFFFRTFSKKFSNFTPRGLEMSATYWHFVDILWIYLFVFFLIEL